MNKFRTEGPNGCIDFTNKHGNFCVQFDAEDFDRIKNIRWFVVKASHTFYCVGRVGYGEGRYLIRLHQLILSFPIGQEVDHINHNGLDNRKSNLRPATTSQNQANARRFKRSGIYRGVRATPSGRFEAAIVKNGKNYYLGSFLDPREAAEAYNSAAKGVHDGYSILN